MHGDLPFSSRDLSGDRPRGASGITGISSDTDRSPATIASGYWARVLLGFAYLGNTPTAALASAPKSAALLG